MERSLARDVRKNGFIYRILERSRGRYFAAVINPETGHVIGYETGRIIVYPTRVVKRGGQSFRVKGGEDLVCNAHFGITDSEGFFAERDRDKAYGVFTGAVSKKGETKWVVQDEKGTIFTSLYGSIGE
jgi:hypothetical protein